MLKFANFYAF